MRRLSGLPWGQSRAALVQGQVSVHGLRMGVRSDGAAFVAADSAAGLCGFATAAGLEPVISRKVSAAREPIVVERGGLVHGVYTAQTCVALLEAVARETPPPDPYAKHNADILSTARLRDLIRNQAGYAAVGEFPNEWRRLHARVALIYNYVSQERFTPVKELSDLAVHAARDGRPTGGALADLFQVAHLWGSHWQDRDLDRSPEPRSLYLNAYPAHLLDGSNPARPYCYPASTLNDFRAWLSGTALTVTWLKPLVAPAWPVSVAELALPPDSAASGEA